MSSASWDLYLLECHDRSLYLGMTQEVSVRVQQHWRGRGGRYTRSRGVAAVVGVMAAGSSRAEAAKQERRLKRLSAVDKRAAFSDQTLLRALTLPDWKFLAIDGRDACWMPPRLLLRGEESDMDFPERGLSQLNASSAAYLVALEIEETLGGGDVPSIAQWTSWLRLLHQVANTLQRLHST